MANSPIYTVKYRRKREGRTNYKKRLAMLKGNTSRLVIRRSNKSIVVQIVKYNPDGDNVVVTFNSTKLVSYGWNFSKKSLPAAYLTGLALGKIALAKGIENAIVDLGLQSPVAGSKLYATLKGVIDAGLKVPANENVFPSEDRINGSHIANAGEIASKFTGYKKANLDIAKITETFENVKKKIMQ